jgi:outer membrane protein assembly factor BamB
MILPMRALLLLAAAALEWSSFRGPNGSGVSQTTGLPVEFGPERNVEWKTSVPRGTSSPVLTSDRIFLTATDGPDLLTLCLDRGTGSILWRRAITKPRSEQLHKLNSPASATPVTDGRNVYSFFGDFGLVSYGPDGEERWRMPLGPFSNLHGMGASPILLGDRLILLADQDTNSYLMAIGKDSGKMIWKTERREVVHGFATPTVFRPAGGITQIIVPGSYVLDSYDADSGRKLWWVRGLTWQVKTTAVTDGEVIYATGWAPGADAGERKNLPAFEDALKEADKDGNRKLAPEEIPPHLKHSGSWTAIDLDHDGYLDSRDWSFYRARRASHNVTLAVRPGRDSGDLTDTHVLWSQERFVPQVSSPLLYQGILYTIKDGGILTAFNPKSGEILKQSRLRDALDAYYSSPVASDGKVYVVSENGKAVVIKAGADWEVLAVNDLSEPCYATPALSDGRIYMRTASALYSFSARK